MKKNVISWANEALKFDGEEMHITVSQVGTGWVLVRVFTYEPGMEDEMTFEGHELILSRHLDADTPIDSEEDIVAGEDAPCMSGSYQEMVDWVQSLPNQL
jgi:hypothetical protein